MKKIDIVGLGEVVVDWVAEVPHFPRPDEKIDALSENHFPGGVTANFLVAVSRLGVSCGFIGAVGSDGYGEFLLNDFKKENIDISQTFQNEDQNTPVNFIFVTGGEKTIIQSPHMKTTKITPEQLNPKYIKRAKVLHTTAIHPEVTRKAISLAKDYGTKVSIDLEAQIASRGWEELEELLLKADILIPNKEGARTLTKSNNIEEAANTLIDWGIPVVIITMGEEGALITTENVQEKIPANDVDEVVDTTGAGDTFNGAFSVAYWIKGWSLERACRYANAAAALKIQKLGARTGMPSERQLKTYLEQEKPDFFDS